jgi:transposase-like protein/IS1 family transposase
MTCIRCTHGTCRKFGYYGKRRIQRWRCTSCRATFSTPAPKLGTHYTDPEAAAKVLTLMLEGMSVRAISRFTGLHKHTILSLMLTASEKARQVSNAKIQNISPRFVQLDEMWGYVHTREPNLNEGDPEEWGSTMLWLAIDSESKLLISHHIGSRNGISAHAFVNDLRKRTNGRYQVTSDQLNAYVGAMREHFGQNVDFGQLHKIYGRVNTDGWYGGGQVVGAVPHVKIGRPDFSRISTSHIERANLSVRMHLRRFTRLTNAFSKKLSNLEAAVTLYVAFYNFCRRHQTHKGATPAMAAGLTDHAWSIAELLSAA